MRNQLMSASWYLAHMQQSGSAACEGLGRIHQRRGIARPEFTNCAAPRSAGSPGDKMCSLHTRTVPCPPFIATVQMPHLGTQCASTVSCTTRQIWQRTDIVAAGARRAVQLLAVATEGDEGGPTTPEGVKAVVTGDAAHRSADRAVVCQARAVRWCERVGRLAACAGRARARPDIVYT